MRSRCVGWVGLLMVVASACGGSSDSASPFTPTPAVADVCSLLTLSDVQTLVPGATAGTPLTLDDTANFWMRGCAWQASGKAVTLIVQGALTSNGTVALGIEVNATSNATTTATAVTGVGDKAVYLVNQGLDQVLNARKGNTVVSVAASGFTPEVPESSLQPLAVEALAKL